jgi:NitT/TauT family transport system substrate-binding protein
VATSENVISEEPAEGAFRSDIAEAAVASLDEEGLDTTGEDYEPIEVEVTPGGE